MIGLIKLFKKMLRQIGLVNICPSCYSLKTKLTSVSQNLVGTRYNRICIDCGFKYTENEF